MKLKLILKAIILGWLVFTVGYLIIYLCVCFIGLEWYSFLPLEDTKDHKLLRCFICMGLTFSPAFAWISLYYPKFNY